MEVLVARIGKPHGLRGEVTVQTHTDAPRERFVRGAVFETRPRRGTLTLRGARLHQGVWLLAFEEAADRSAAEALRGSRLVLDVPVDGAGGTGGDDAGAGAQSAESADTADTADAADTADTAESAESADIAKSGAWADAGDGPPGGLEGEGPDGEGPDGERPGDGGPGDGPDEGWYPDELVGLPVRDPAGAVIGEVTQLLTRPAQDLLQVRLLDGRSGLVPFVAALVPTVVATGAPGERHVVVDAPAGLFDLG